MNATQKKRWWLAGLGAVLLGSVALIWAAQPAAESERVVGAPNGINLIVISLDTLRADRLGVYGYQRPTTPAIDKLSEAGIVFEKAIAASSWTIPSHATLFTGLYPSTHSSTSTRFTIPPDVPLLAEILKAKGYRTFGFTGGGNLGRRHAFHRGFDEYRAKEFHRPSGKKGLAAGIHRSIEALESVPAGTPFFLFLHTYDIHCPYPAPEPYYSMFQSTGASAPQKLECGVVPGKRRPVSSAEALWIGDRYDGAARSADAELDAFFSFLRRKGLLEKTVIVLTSDHGEEFLEHGAIGHQASLNIELLHTPLILFAPGYAPRRVAAAVSQIDVFPTVLSLLNIAAPAGTQGQPLTPLMRGEHVPVRDCFSELHRAARLRSIFSDPYHLIVNDDKGTTACFDTLQDRLEQRPLHNDERCDELKQRLDSFFEDLPVREKVPARKPKKMELDRLKSLGYF